MRGLIYGVAAVVLTVMVGCGDQNRVPPQEQARASNPRTNLYPLSAPSQGAVQPVQGYAPTRVTANYDYNAQPAYGAQGGYATQPAYYAGGTANTYAGFPSGSTIPGPEGGVCRVEDVTAYSNPNVPINDPPAVVNYQGGSYAAGSYGNVPTSYGGGARGTPPTSYNRLSASYPTTAGGIFNDPRPGLHYGPVEGTADIVTNPSLIGPIGAPTSVYAPPVSSAYRAPVTTTAYAPTTTYASTTTTTTYSQPVTTTTYAAPVTTTYAAPATTAAYVPPAPTATTTGYVGGAYPALSANIPASFSAGPASPVGDVSEIKLVPALDIPPNRRPNDAAPSQWFEVVRPGNGPLRIGRVNATCVCVGVRVPKRFVAAGERALIEARILSRPPANNLTYGIYVGIVEPQQTVVDADVTITL